MKVKMLKPTGYNCQIRKSGTVHDVEPEVAERWEARGIAEIVEDTIAVDKMTLQQLREFAVENDIDLQGAEKKADILAAIIEAGQEVPEDKDPEQGTSQEITQEG